MMATGMGYGVYIFFATMLVFASVYAYFFIHETKGLRMDQMDELFGFARPGTDYAAKALDDEEADASGIGNKADTATRVEMV